MSEAASSFLARRYSSDAEVYDDLWSPVIRPVGEQLINAMPLQEATRVLDAGIGAGALVPAIQRVARHADVFGLDVASRMLRLAVQRHDVSCVSGDAMAMPFASGSVDAVVLAYVLFHLRRPAAALAEATRIVRDGGVVGVITWAAEGTIGAGSLLDRALDHAGAPMTPWTGEHEGLNSPDHIRTHLQRAGLIELALWTAPIAHQFTIESFWRLRTTGSNSGWRLRQLQQAQRETVLAEVRRDFEQLRPDQLRFRGEVIVAVAQRP
jgi:ubiquinone/menaquinone biosynthesis C-methylase UbiE